MNESTTGLMRPSSSAKPKTPITDAYRNHLFGGSAPQSLEKRLSNLAETESGMLKRMSQMVLMAQSFHLKAKGKYAESYKDVIQRMYPSLALHKQDLLEDLLQALEPITPDMIKPRQPAPTGREYALKLYETYKVPSEAVSNAPAAKTSFIERLTQSESSGNTLAEITIADGRKFSGALQFGEARLADYKTASGKRFTQDEFKADNALQDKVAAWHVADIDKTIDGLGLNTDGFDRDGLRAVAHLGGKGGMKKFVRTKGEYNPSDELGTSLQDYYDKFTVQS